MVTFARSIYRKFVALSNITASVRMANKSSSQMLKPTQNNVKNSNRCNSVNRNNFEGFVFFEAKIKLKQDYSCNLVDSKV